ncbi:unnamed protein product [Anisakis simplex]|uniref:26S proteasome regulatory subunit p27 n=1 Tax=Anisakis simplex TaxID=6269 RepID=A0A0M3K8F6_ANISI|nr:unnamed protein product [Anisakis simplex]
MISLEDVKKLIAKRDDIDKQIAEYDQILKENGVDLHSPLVDAEGYPLPNIDLYSVRSARQSIICASNDRKQLTVEIEDMMLQLHAMAKQNSSSSSNQNSLQNDDQSNEIVKRTSNRVFAKIDTVAPSSPAHEAGLKNGDPIVQFGSLHAENFSDINQLAGIVQNSVGKKIRITVIREGHAERLELVPRQWSGRGVLGCSVVPISSAEFI